MTVAALAHMKTVTACVSTTGYMNAVMIEFRRKVVVATVARAKRFLPDSM